MEGVATFDEFRDGGVSFETRFIRQFVHANVTVIIRHAGRHFRWVYERRIARNEIDLVTVSSAVSDAVSNAIVWHVIGHFVLPFRR